MDLSTLARRESSKTRWIEEHHYPPTSARLALYDYVLELLGPLCCWVFALVDRSYCRDMKYTAPYSGNIGPV